MQASHANLSQVVDELDSLIHAALPGSTNVELDLMQEIPAIKADTAQIRQVVMNLLTNAGEAMSGEGGIISIKTGVVAADRDYLASTYVDDSLPAGNYVFLEITDRGCGMDQATLSRIFDPFFTTKFTGRGLGLAAVLGIVRAHRGAINFDSTPGHGTTVHVLFPSLDEASDNLETAAEGGEAAQHEGAVLIVDDERVVRETGASLLRHGGYHVFEANSGEEALRFLADNPRIVNAVLLDLTMPGLDGKETFHRIREVDPDVKVYLCSGYSDVELAERFGADGFTGFLHKPYGLRELMKTLQHA